MELVLMGELQARQSSTATNWRNWRDWDGLTLVWEPGYLCNYRCSYCPWEMSGSWDAIAPIGRDIPANRWIAAFDRVEARCGTAHIRVIGGEPLTHPSMPELLAAVSKKHFMTVITNLSLPPLRLEHLLRRLSPDRARFGASFHPQFARLEGFLERLRLLRRQGFEAWTSLVAWPPFLPRLRDWAACFARERIPFYVELFFGRLGQRSYPDGYTRAELDELRPFIPELKAKYILEESPSGRDCGSGFVYAKVRGNGDVFRCGSAVGHGSAIGNLFDEGFQFLDRPMPCPLRQCFCGESMFLWQRYAANGRSGQLLRRGDRH